MGYNQSIETTFVIKMVEHHRLSRLSSFGIGVALSSITTTAVTLSYAVAYNIQNMDVPILTGIGVSVVGLEMFVCGALSRRPTASKQALGASKPEP